MPAEKIELSDMVQHLRHELTRAMTQAEGETLRFELQSIKVEIEISVSRDVAAGAGLKFWVVEAEASGHHERVGVQKVTLDLTPRMEGLAGPFLLSR